MFRKRNLGNTQIQPALGEGLLQPLGYNMNDCQSCGYGIPSQNIMRNGKVWLNQSGQELNPSWFETIMGVEQGQSIGTVGITMDFQTALTLGLVVAGGLVVGTAITKRL